METPAYYPPKINLNRSLELGRLTLFSEGLKLYTNYFASALFILCGFIFSIRFYNFSITISMVFLVFAIWMICNLIFFSKLVEIEHITYSQDKFIESVISRYPHLEVAFSDDDKVVQLYKLKGFFNTRVINILLDDQSAYVNVIKIGRGNAFSPFHGLVDYLECKRIKRMCQ